MKINETGDKALNLAGATLKKTEEGIRFTQDNLATLSMGNDSSEEESEGDVSQDRPVLPTDFMSRMETMEWNHLTARQKESFIENAVRERRTGKRVNWMQEEPVQQSQETGRQGEYGQQIIEDAKKGDVKENRVSAESIRSVSTDNANVGPQTVMSGAETTGKTAAETGTSGSVGSASAGTAAETASAGAATSGVGLAAAVGKKAAESFKNALAAKSMAAEQQLGKSQLYFELVRNDNRAMSSPKQTLLFVGSSVMVAVLGILQFAASMLFSVFLLLIAAVIAVLTVLLIVTVVVSVVAAFLSNSSQDGAKRLVEVAVSQEGVTDGTPYWEYTMGSAFVNGSATPWCASFVSWCANECGYIDDGIFPKSGAVRTYRQFYESRGLFFDADGYIPKTGDLIIFWPSHIGIVQYVENSIVVTIEGNTTDSVRSRAYSLTNSRIVGYCTPQYPREADFTGSDAEEITYNFLRSQGCTRETAVAILGNLKQESGVDPTRYQAGGGPGRGICQWEEGSDRFQNLVQRAEAAGKDWTDLQVQLEFLWYELSGGETTCQYILNRDYGGLGNFLNSTDIAWSVEAFERSFERAGRPMMSQRIQYANEYYERFTS